MTSEPGKHNTRPAAAIAVKIAAGWTPGAAMQGGGNRQRLNALLGANTTNQLESVDLNDRPTKD